MERTLDAWEFFATVAAEGVSCAKGRIPLLYKIPRLEHEKEEQMHPSKVCCRDFSVQTEDKEVFTHSASNNICAPENTRLKCLSSSQRDVCHKYCTNQRSICVQNERVRSTSSFFTY